MRITLFWPSQAGPQTEIYMSFCGYYFLMREHGHSGGSSTVFCQHCLVPITRQGSRLSSPMGIHRKYDSSKLPFPGFGPTSTEFDVAGTLSTRASRGIFPQVLESRRGRREPIRMYAQPSNPGYGHGSLTNVKPRTSIRVTRLSLLCFFYRTRWRICVRAVLKSVSWTGFMNT